MLPIPSQPRKTAHTNFVSAKNFILSHITVYFNFQVGEDQPLFPGENQVRALTQMQSVCVSFFLFFFYLYFFIWKCLYPYSETKF